MLIEHYTEMLSVPCLSSQFLREPCLYLMHLCTWGLFQNHGKLSRSPTSSMLEVLRDEHFLDQPSANAWRDLAWKTPDLLSLQWEESEVCFARFSKIFLWN